MSRDKQIEFERNEISEIIAQNFKLNDEQYDPSDFEWSAHCVQCAGYRKAFDLVNEIFADVFKAIRKYYIEAEHTKSVTCELMLDYLKGDLAELKKKYTEGEG